MGVYYFSILVTFLFVLGGFYQVLSKVGAYQKLTNSIAKKLKGKEILFVVIVSLFFTALAAIMTEYYIILVFIPFFITIMSKMKLHKITAFAATFGAILIGLLGSLYNNQVTGVNADLLNVEYTEYYWYRLIILAVAFLVFTIYNVIHIKKTLKSKKDEVAPDLFVNEEVDKKTKVWPLAIIAVLFLVITILAYVPWYEAFGIEFFNNITTSFREFEIFGQPIFAYIFGSFDAFGEWDLFGVQITMLVTAVIIKLVYSVKTDDFITSFGEGFMKTGKMVVLLLTIYLVLVITVMFPVIPVIVDSLMNSESFNIFSGMIAGLVTGLFSVEYQYAVSLSGLYFVTTYPDLTNQMSILMQSTFGLAMFFAPTSAIMLIGLSFSDISYKEWLKYIWQFILIMLVVIIVIMFIIV